MPHNHKLVSILEHLRQAIQHLETKQQLQMKEYLNMWDERDIVERELTKGIQSSLDCGARMIAENGWERPDDNHGILDVLAAHEVVTAEIATNMKELTGLRNVLAHEYRRIRDDEVYQHLQSAPSILKEFARAIASYESCN